jgi:hypothetical protein
MRGLNANQAKVSYALGLSPNWTVRSDSLGTTNLGYDNTEALVPAASNRWQSSPYVVEPNSAGTEAMALDQVKRYKLGLVSSIFPARGTTYEEACRRSGYRISPASVAINEPLSSGGPMAITTQWRNEGVAPPAGYPPFVIEYQLRAGGSVLWTGSSAFDIRTLLPTAAYSWNAIGSVPAGTYAGSGLVSVTDKFAVPSLAPGPYDLALRVRDPSNVKHMALALVAPSRNSDGSYTLGSVMLVK